VGINQSLILKVRERIESDLNLRFQVAVWIATVLIGAYSFYLQRYAMNPDAISYIDLGTNFEVSGLWSPAFAWLIGIVCGFRPNPCIGISVSALNRFL